MRTKTAVLLLFFASPGVGQELYCAHPGFNMDIATTAVGIRCGPSALQRGIGLISSDGIGNLTSDSAAFTFEAGSSPSGWTTEVVEIATGLTYVYQGLRYWGPVSSKSSNSQISVTIGSGVPPSFTGVSDWSWWETRCYKSFGTYNSLETRATAPTNRRLWGVLGTASVQGLVWDTTSSQAWAMTLLVEGIATTAVVLWRPAFNPTKGGSGHTAGMLTSPTVGEYRHQLPSGSSPWPYAAGGEFQISIRGESGSASYPVICLARAPVSHKAP